MYKIVLPGLIFVLASTISGCDQKSTTAQTPAPATTTQQQDTQPTQAAEPPAPAQANMTIQHPSGESVVMKNPQRVITLDFGTLDTLDELGLSDRIVGMPTGSIPDYLSSYDGGEYVNAGNMKEPDLEAIRQAKPDVIVITGRQGKSYDQLAEIAPTINLSIDGKNYLGSFKHNAETVGKLFDKQAEVEKALAELNKKMADYQAEAKASDLKALVIMHNANKLSVANTGSYATIIHDLAGIKRADENTEAKRQAADDAYFSTVNPDIIFIVDRDAAIGQDKFVPALLETDTIKNTNAYKNDRVVYLTPDLWYLSGGGLKSLSLQLDEAIAAIK